MKSTDSLLTRKGDSSYQKVRVNVDILFGTIKCIQKEWDKLDFKAITYMEAIIIADITVYIEKYVIAKKVYDYFQQVCDIPTTEESTQRYAKWSNYCYKDFKLEEFL